MLEKSKSELFKEQGPIENIVDIFSGLYGKEFYIFIEDGMSRSGEECSWNIFYNIYKIKLIKIQSKRKATVELTQCIFGGLTEKVTIVVGKYKKRYGEYDNYRIKICKNNSNPNSWNQYFEPYIKGTLDEIILVRSQGTFMAGYFNNPYLTERVNRLIIRRVRSILHKTIKLKENEDSAWFEKVCKLGSRYYSMWRYKEKFNRILNTYYSNYNKFPDKYTLEGRINKKEER